MELFRTLREKSQLRHQLELHRQAEDFITLSDFDSSMYIAYQGNPLIQISEDWTSKQVLEELTKIRQNFINSKIKDTC